MFGYSLVFFTVVNQNETGHLLNQVDERDFMNLKEDDDAAHYEEQIADKKQQAAKDSESIKIGGTEADSETSENPVVAKKTGRAKSFW